MPSPSGIRPDATAAPSAAAAAQARFWNRAAPKYARAAIADAAGHETTLRRVAALLAPTHAVLEVGCGTGTTALRLAATTRRMLATDLSDGMIAIARERLAARPQERLRFAVAPAEAGAPDGEPRDAVLAFSLLHLVPDLDTVLAAVLRSLVPGGLFVSKTPCLGEMNPLVPHLLVPLMRALGKAPAVRVFDAARLAAALARHGFAIEAVERHGSTRRDVRVFIVARRPR